MAKLVYFVYCANIEARNVEKDMRVFDNQNKDNIPNPPNQVPCIINPYVMIKVLFIPTTYTIGFSMGIKEVDSSKNKEVVIEIVNPENNSIFKTAVPISGKNNELIDNNGIVQVAGMINNLILDKEGTYISKIAIDGEALGEAELEVKK